MSDEVIQHLDEECGNCGTELTRISPEDGEKAAVICDPEKGGCGVVARYEDQ